MNEDGEKSEEITLIYQTCENTGSWESPENP